MSVYDDIRFVKGSYDVTLFTVIPTENLKNAIQFVPPVQTPGNQSLGPRRPKASDLLKITESFVFKTQITKTSTKSAQEIKAELKQIFKGGGIDGGSPVTMHYEDETFPVYITDLVIKRASDVSAKDTYADKDMNEYDVTITCTIAEDVA